MVSTYIAWIHWIQRHSRWWFISIHPDKTGPNPVPPTAARAKSAMGSPRLWMSMSNAKIKGKGKKYIILIRAPDVSNGPAHHSSASGTKCTGDKAKNKNGLNVLRADERTSIDTAQLLDVMNLQCDAYMRHHEDECRGEIKWLSSKFFA